MFGTKKTVPHSAIPAASPVAVSPKPLERKRSKALWQKRIPTLAGLGVLIVAMVAGVLLFGNGTGVFAPRATPQTTPKNIKISNITDTSFTVSFLTDEATPAFLKYGISAKDLDNQAGDERDQITGTVKPYNLHHITIRGLTPNTSYYFTLGTGSNSSFTNNGEPFQTKTAAQAGSQPVAKTVYGSVTTESGAPAEGAIVYVKHPDAGELSSLVKSSGSWAVYLSNARTVDGSDYASTTDDDTILVSVQGPDQTKKASITTTVGKAQPVESISYGQTSAQAGSIDTSQTLTATEESPATESATVALETQAIPDIQADETMAVSETVETASESAVATESAVVANTVIDLDEAKTATQTVTTTQPKIVGMAAPNVTISIQVHSETQISQEITADESGNFELDIAALSENLKPGEHTVTYTYTDPQTGEEVSETITFYVAENATAQTQPYGSGNPYPVASPTPSPTPVASPSPSPTMEATPSAVATEEARVALPATDSAIPVSGSVGTTIALVFGGLFFIISGAWSFWISSQLQRGKLEI